MLSVIQELNEQLGVRPLHEVLTKEQYNEIFQEAKFGLEIEVQVPDDLQDDFDKGMQILGESTAVNFFIQLANLYKTDKVKFKLIADKFQEKTGFSNSSIAIQKIFPLLNKYGEVFVGGYGTGRSKDGWRVETDGSLSRTYGMEVVTPLNRGEAFTYEQCISEVPKVSRYLFDIGFNGVNGKTGLHINISVGDKLNVSAMRALLTNLRNKYNDFAIACYLTSQESDALFQHGLYARKNNTYSKAFISKFNEQVKSTAGIGKYMINTLIGIANKALGDSTGQNYIIKIPVALFVEKSARFPSGFRWIVDEATSYFNEAMTGSHYIDFSARGNRIELRGFGGAKGFDQYRSPDNLGKVLRLAVAQFLPFLDTSSITLQGVLRAIEINLRETLIPELQKRFKTLNALKMQPQFNRNNMEGFPGVSDVQLSNTEVKKAFIDNTCTGVILDTSIREITAVITKGVTEFRSAEQSSATAGMRDTLSQQADYTADIFKQKAPKLPKDISLRALSSAPITVTPASQVSATVVDPVPNVNEPHTSTEPVINLAGKYFYINFMSNPILKGVTLGFDYGDAYRYKLVYDNNDEGRRKATEAFQQITRYVARAPHGYVSRRWREEGTTYRDVYHLSPGDVHAMNIRQSRLRNTEIADQPVLRTRYTTSQPQLVGAR